MTPNDPRESFDLPSSRNVIAAAAIMVGTLLDAHPDKREWLEGSIERQAGAFPEAAHLQHASELIMREVDEPLSVIGALDV